MKFNWQVKLLAKILKKIKKKIVAQSKSKEEPKSQVKQKKGSDILLVIVLAVTLAITVAAWNNLDNLNQALYVTLIISLALTYARRQFNVSEKVGVWIERAGMAAMGFALALFAIVIYNQIFS